MKKTFCSDTNIFIYDPNAIFSFEDNDVVIPFAVLEEIDKQKHRSFDEVGKNARATNRILDDLRKQGDLTKGVKLPGGGTLKIVKSAYSSLMPEEADKTLVDNFIISTALELQKKLKNRVRLISKDISMRIKCDMLGVPCDDYLKHRVAGQADLIYSGVRVITTTKQNLDEFFKFRTLNVEKLNLDEKMLPNEYVVLKTTESSTSGLAKFVNGELKPIINNDEVWGLKPKNKEQRFALDALFDDNVKLATLIGPAGCVVPETSVTVKLSNIKLNIKPVPVDIYAHERSDDWET